MKHNLYCKFIRYCALPVIASLYLISDYSCAGSRGSNNNHTAETIEFIDSLTDSDLSSGYILLQEGSDAFYDDDKKNPRPEDLTLYPVFPGPKGSSTIDGAYTNTSNADYTITEDSCTDTRNGAFVFSHKPTRPHAYEHQVQNQSPPVVQQCTETADHQKDVAILRGTAFEALSPTQPSPGSLTFTTRMSPAVQERTEPSGSDFDSQQRGVKTFLKKKSSRLTNALRSFVSPHAPLKQTTVAGITHVGVHRTNELELISNDTDSNPEPFTSPDRNHQEIPLSSSPDQHFKPDLSSDFHQNTDSEDTVTTDSYTLNDGDSESLSHSLPMQPDTVGVLAGATSVPRPPETISSSDLHSQTHSSDPPTQYQPELDLQPMEPPFLLKQALEQVAFEELQKLLAHEQEIATAYETYYLQKAETGKVDSALPKEDINISDTPPVWGTTSLVKMSPAFEPGMNVLDVPRITVSYQGDNKYCFQCPPDAREIKVGDHLNLTCEMQPGNPEIIVTMQSEGTDCFLQLYSPDLCGLTFNFGPHPQKTLLPLSNKAQQLVMLQVPESTCRLFILLNQNRIKPIHAMTVSGLSPYAETVPTQCTERYGKPNIIFIGERILPYFMGSGIISTLRGLRAKYFEPRSRSTDAFVNCCSRETFENDVTRFFLTECFNPQRAHNLVLCYDYDRGKKTKRYCLRHYVAPAEISPAPGGMIRRVVAALPFEALCRLNRRMLYYDNEPDNETLRVLFEERRELELARVLYTAWEHERRYDRHKKSDQIIYDVLCWLKKETNVIKEGTEPLKTGEHGPLPEEQSQKINTLLGGLFNTRDNRDEPGKANEFDLVAQLDMSINSVSPWQQRLEQLHQDRRLKELLGNIRDARDRRMAQKQASNPGFTLPFWKDYR